MKKTALFLVISSLAPLPLLAQEAAQPARQKPPTHYYKLTLTVEETNDAGQAVNARSYVATVQTGSNVEQIRTGTRVPIATGSIGTTPATTQFTYIDIGVNVEETGDRLAMNVRADVSSVGELANIGNMKEPVIRSNKWDSAVLIPIGKPTVVFSADDLNDKGKMQVELTATRID
jgi:hypothetical protein